MVNDCTTFHTVRSIYNHCDRKKESAEGGECMMDRKNTEEARKDIHKREWWA